MLCVGANGVVPTGDRVAVRIALLIAAMLSISISHCDWILVQ
jgi:hypothetical protein